MHRMLVIDDSLAVRPYVQAASVDRCEVLGSASGVDAMRALPRSGIGLVTAAINMRDINDYELLHFIRTRALHHAIPVLMVSTLASEQERAPSLAANALLLKPCTERGLRAGVHALLAPATVAVRASTASTASTKAVS